MKTKTINIYEFEELKPEIQEKVLNYFRNNNEFPFLSEELTELLKEKLEESKIGYNDSLKIYYSLSYCQGDGFCFIGDFDYKDYKVLIKHIGNYYHSNSVSIDIVKTDTEGNEINAEENIYIEFKELYKSICRLCENQGYAEIEYENSEECIKENIKANEYKFRENGDIE